MDGPKAAPRLGRSEPWRAGSRGKYARATGTMPCSHEVPAQRPGGHLSGNVRKLHAGGRMSGALTLYEQPRVPDTIASGR